MVASRLDRLVTLLDKGSTQLIRNTAATQLADIQKQTPDSLFALLSRILPFLQSKSWDTRTAAAKAIGGIVANAEPFDPNEDDDHNVKTDDVKFEPSGPGATSDQLLRLVDLNLALILENGKPLLSSASREYELSQADLSPSERLARQKKSLFARLGLTGEPYDEELDVDTELIAKAAKPVHITKKNGAVTVKRPSRSTSPSPGSPQVEGESLLSKRQLNQLKRQQKMSAKSGANKMRVVDLSARQKTNSASTPTPHPVRVNGKEDGDSEEDGRPDYFNIKREGSDDDTQLIKEFKGENDDAKPVIQPDESDAPEWPYEVMCDFLAYDLFSPYWDIRHGAALGLREVLRVHAKGAGRQYGRSRCDNDLANKHWLDEMACRLLCVLMLDRFGDYVSDTVVAPIRESVGQTLGVLLTRVSDDTAVEIYDILQQMISQTNTGLKQPIWQVCHGGMIGLRYFVAVKKDLLLERADLIDGVLAAVTRGLAHSDDDVKSVSAATLVPMVAELTTARPDSIGPLMLVVWDCLLDMQDDLSASTGAVMDLLANLCSYPTVLQAMAQNARDDPEQSFNSLIPRLYPFFRHTITSVRMSVVKALATFLNTTSLSGTAWIDWRLIRLLFQDMLLERNEGVLRAAFELWSNMIDVLKEITHSPALEPHIMPMVRCATQPIGQPLTPIPLDTTLLIKSSGAPMAAALPRHNGHDDQHSRKRRKVEEEPQKIDSHNVDGHIINGDVELVGMETLLRTRITCARALGLLLPLQSSEAIDNVWSHLTANLRSTFSTDCMFSSMVMGELASSPSARPKNARLEAVGVAVQHMLDHVDEGWYSDLVHSLRLARGQCDTLLNAFHSIANVPRHKLPTVAVLCQGEPHAGPSAFSLKNAETIVGDDFDRLLKALSPAQRIAGIQALRDARDNAKEVVEQAKRVKESRDIAVRSAGAAVLIALREIPKKPGQLIKCIMDSIKAEEYEEVQQRSATAVAALIDFYTQSPKKGPVDKLVSNLTKFSCVDTSETPEYGPNSESNDIMLSLRKEEDRKDHPDAARFEREAKEARIMRRGSKLALGQLAKLYGKDLMHRLPVLQSLIERPLQSWSSQASVEKLADADGQEVVDALSIMRTLTPMVDEELHSWILSQVPVVTTALRSNLSVIRYMAAKCFATVCSTLSVQAMTVLVQEVMPNIGNPLSLHDRQGITECVYHLIQIMGDQILPYVIFLIVPVLGRMSDSNEDVRLLATTSFATLVKLVPLEAGIPDPPGMPEALLRGRERERQFMAQMLDPKKVEAFQIPVAIKAELRPYQQDGVNWLNFLNKYNLHGVLCDDMGLGKTLQTLCMVASDHHMRAEEYARTQAPDKRRLPSLIVCPPSLSGHWQQEISQFAPFLTCVAYVGGPGERNSRKHLLADADIVVTTYDICRNESDVLTALTWNYCVLDEGHLIKNPKAKITQAVKKVNSNHRLILSGTPIQNNVLELWSLFDFLMPGFLGTERVFHDRFAKPIAASRNAKSSSREQETGALAIEALHKQVLPFLLRRLKEEVLNDLPPKILQNYYCDLSDLQRQLFDDFFKKEKKTVEASVDSNDKEAKQHIFQSLQYMRKLCNSPALVVKEGNAQYDNVQKQLAASKSNLRDVAHAPKLRALRDLLVDCGIGVDDKAADASASTFVSPHHGIFDKLLPGVQHLRLDGSVEATKRQSIVNKFNNDPSYDCLLLTTSVGGLGLNLTGADTVIFVEHDWNPQKDIQAMDRAHRIGQKKVVNVYRLITRGTLEEKILSLQRFKIDVASTVVNQQNAGLGTMETDQILDLFNLDTPDLAATGETAASKDEDLVDVETGEVKKKGEKGWLNDVGDLWDDRQYQEEFNLDSFVQNLQK
ncbi:TATA-binding protein-associated factor MOT1 [Cyphellophora attinorum]|uniref:TATA-binding protein-associated factor MOT1 n=1 Tax=Cyphellophora attinorum TaxID=1664694 RepID=A0A0N1NWR0_9EURO|nr:TATA-binding protein-associated factor MOT1 [Phialophora attinorum]KPI37186.1 TATA-binding protein-associated factor MOT1 [Phialophora attinorum]